MRSQGRLVFGLLILFTGFWLMAGTFGLLRPGLLLAFTRWWPLLLIALGISLLLGRRGRLASLVVLGLVLVLALGSLWLFGAPGDKVHSTFGPTGFGAAELSEFNLRLLMADGQVRVGTPIEALYAVALEHRRGAASSVFNVTGDVGHATVSTTRGIGVLGGLAGPTTAVLRFDRVTPLNLEVKVAAGEINLDLRPYPLRRLTVDCTAGQVMAWLPAAAGTLTANVTVRAGEANIMVPQGVGLRVWAQARLDSQDLAVAGLQRIGDYWQDELYDTADSRVELVVTATIGQVRITRY